MIFILKVETLVDGGIIIISALKGSSLLDSSCTALPAAHASSYVASACKTASLPLTLGASREQPGSRQSTRYSVPATCPSCCCMCRSRTGARPWSPLPTRLRPESEILSMVALRISLLSNNRLQCCKHN